MRIVQINTEDVRGGAARAAYRLHQGLQRLGQDCQMLVRHKTSADNTVLGVVNNSAVETSAEALFLSGAIQGRYLDAHRTELSNTVFSLPYPGFDLTSLPQVQAADVINLHWVAYFQSLSTLRKLLALDKSVVWTLHDQGPFTGGCHYTAGCSGYLRNCSACPQLATDTYDLPAAILQDKLNLFKNTSLTIVTPSRWLAECVEQSRLFRTQRVEIIPNSLDIETYYPIPKPEAKSRLGLEPDTMTLLFSAQDGREKRKGFSVLQEALHFCLDDPSFQGLVARDRVKLLCLGHPSDDLAHAGFPIHILGHLESDDDIRLAYSAANIFVLPSLEDNLPNTILEAMSCGTPVIGSRVGGIPELVADGKTGYLVSPGESHQLGNTILTSIFDPERLAAMGSQCRKVIEQGYTLETQAKRYLALYEELSQPQGQTKQVTAGLNAPSNHHLAHVAQQSGDYVAGLDIQLGPHFQRIYQLVLFKALQEFVPTIHEQWRVSETDRAARLVVINQLSEQLTASETDRAARLAVINQLSEQLTASEADRAARLIALNQLGEQLAASEADRTARLAVINQLSEQLTASEADRMAQNEQLKAGAREREDLLRTITQLDQSLISSGAERAAQSEVINRLKGLLATNEEQLAHQAHQIRELQSMVIWLSTTKGALRKLLGNFSRRTGIYPFLMRHRNTLRNIYRFPLSIVTKFRKIDHGPQPPSSSKLLEARGFAPSLQPRDLINSPLVEALVSARSLMGDASEGTLVKFHELGTQLHRVLCIHPSARNIQALHMLAQAGAEATCISRPDSEGKIVRFGFSAIHLSLADWLQATGAAALTDYDGLLLDASTDIDILSLLKDRVEPDVTIMIQGNPTDEALSEFKWVSAQSKDGELTVFGRSLSKLIIL